MAEHNQALLEHCGKMLGLEAGWKVSWVELSTQKMKLEQGVTWVRSAPP
jgi:hypothetical protein